MENGKPLFPSVRYVMGGREFDFWAATDDRLAAPKKAPSITPLGCSGPTWYRWPAACASSNPAAKSGRYPSH